jgi:hypothetical protein
MARKSESRQFYLFEALGRNSPLLESKPRIPVTQLTDQTSLPHTVRALPEECLYGNPVERRGIGRRRLAVNEWHPTARTRNTSTSPIPAGVTARLDGIPMSRRLTVFPLMHLPKITAPAALLKLRRRKSQG